MKQKRSYKIIPVLVLLIGLTASTAAGKAVVKEEFTLAAIGDCIITHKVSPLTDPAFLKVAELVRSADVTWANCETTLCSLEDVSPSYKAIDPNLFCPPWGADEFKWLGIDLMGLANNHIMDFGKEGLFATLHHLDRVGIGYAGAGKNLDLAGKPGYVDMEVGRISQVSFASWMGEEQNQAASQHPHMKGRPGLNPVNIDAKVNLSAETYGELKKVWHILLDDLDIDMPEAIVKKAETELDFGGRTTFRKAEVSGFAIAPKKEDVDRILEAIKIADRGSRLVIACLHEHRSGKDRNSPTDYQVKLARQCIDAGADVFFATGSHQLGGIEIYKGKPIFHGIGNFFFQELTAISSEAYARSGLPADCKDPLLYAEKFGEYFTDQAIWESMVTRITFDGNNNVKAIHLHPYLLDKDAPTYRRGIPRLADKKEAKRIIERLEKLSKDYKTKFSFKDGVGTVIL